MLIRSSFSVRVLRSAFVVRGPLPPNDERRTTNAGRLWPRSLRALRGGQDLAGTVGDQLRTPPPAQCTGLGASRGAAAGDDAAAVQRHHDRDEIHAIVRADGR